jgi:hypothetical protein
MTTEELLALLAQLGITLEEMMAFSDGVLAPERQDVICDAIKAHPRLIEVVREFLYTKGALPVVYEKLRAEPVPDRVLTTIFGSQRAPMAEPPKRFRFSPPFFGRYRAQVFAVAGLAALIVAAGLPAYLVGQVVGGPERRGVAAPATLQQALERTKTGDTVALLEDKLSLKPTMTYDTAHKLWCREYELRYGEDLWQGGRACRKPDGEWRVWYSTDPEVRPPDKQNSYRAAGEAEKGLNESRREIIAGSPLRLGDEDKLIGGGWRRP